MNQAPSRRLRTHCLLLLPLLLVSLPSASRAGTSTTTSLEALTVTPPVQAGIPFIVSVTARNLSGVDTEYAGTLRFSSNAPRALLPSDYTFNPAVDHGTKTFLVTFQSLGQWDLLVQDVNVTTLSAKLSSVTVTPGPPVGFTVVLDSAVVAGTNYTFLVIPVDSAGNKTFYSGTLHFETSARLAQPPADTSFTYDPLQQPPPPPFPITFYSADPKVSLLVTDVRQGLSGSTLIAVRAGQFHHVELSTTAPEPTPTCSEATIVMTAEDLWDNPVPDVPATAVYLCEQVDRSASFVSTTLNPSTYSSSAKCVTGPLASTAQVVWKDLVAEDVAFTVSGVNAKAPLTLHFRGGIPSPLNSNFSFGPVLQDPAPLPFLTGQLTAELTLRDQCGNPATLPPDKLVSFAATAPLALTPTVLERPGKWTASVTLPECPVDPSKPLAVWPLINDEILKKPNGEQVQRLVLPQCLADVKLALLSPAASLIAKPGEMVEFEVQVSNESDVVVTGGVLMLEPGGLTVAGASLDGQALPAQGAGFELPELRKGSPLTVKVTAQATTQLHQQVSAKIWVASPDGAALTETQSVDFQPKDPGVNVGCVSHAASLPSQLLTWLVLLLVASRPWGGLRRLRRGERIDH
ncbi:MAG: hypothetical protein ACJ8AT_03020 [Hyalangium sp.]|uniref:hypothetical protein n=1 Tax=Hyalangium sp. TaxID=2028555 RepID=UPI003899DA33